MTYELVMAIWITAACSSYNPKRDALMVSERCISRAEKVFRLSCPVGTKTEVCGKRLKAELSLVEAKGEG